MRRIMLGIFLLLAFEGAYAATTGLQLFNVSKSLSTGGVSQSASTGGAPSAATPATTSVTPGTQIQPSVGVLPPVQTDGAAFTQALSPPSAVLIPQAADYQANQKSDVFGANLFTGAFAQRGATQFNPEYAVAVGDSVQLRLWGGYVYDGILVVDPLGNIFLPYVGPILLQGVKNQDLQRVVEAAVRKVFRANVYCYASLAAAQPVRIFVGGYVNHPGLYNGTSLDSLLFFLDQAGGIDPERGSFLNVQVRRGEKIRATVNLYDFLLGGNMPTIQLADGDVLFVPFKHASIRVSGLAGNAKRFQFLGQQIALGELVKLAEPAPSATHIRVTRNTGTVLNVEYFSLEQSVNLTLNDGDAIEFVADKKPGTITVRVQGEHQSQQEYVLPYGSRLWDVLEHITFSDRSDVDNIQLFRNSVREQQRQMLQNSLKHLEQIVLTARSSSGEESTLRQGESSRILQWIDRAKLVDPTGQVVLSKSSRRDGMVDDLLLENGDVLNIPTKSGLVLVAGEVLFPNTIAYDKQLDVEDYIERAGGFTQSADTTRVVIAHLDGSYEEGKRIRVRSGDHVIVIPRMDEKTTLAWKEVIGVIFPVVLMTKMAFPKL